MSRPAIVTDLNRCVGCLACMVACKVANGVPVGKFWCKTERVGPFPDSEGASFPNVYHYFKTVHCQHCANPECVSVCPTGASFIDEDGTVQIAAEQCIGCGLCLDACPYGVRMIDEQTNVAQKCTLCQEKTERGELPQCVAQCGGRARFWGDLDEGIENMRGAGKVDRCVDPSYEAVNTAYCTLGEVCEPFEDADVHRLTDYGNDPSCLYILRRHAWQDAE